MWQLGRYQLVVPGKGFWQASQSIKLSSKVVRPSLGRVHQFAHLPTLA